MIRQLLAGAGAAGAFAALAALAGAAQAQDAFPSEPVKVVVPYSAGGGTDRWSRVMASAAIDHFGEPFRVQIREGAGATIGWRYMLDQEADGHTVLNAAMTPVITVLQEPNPPFTPEDIKMVGFYAFVNVHLMAKPDQPFSDFESLIEYAKENPGALTIGGNGVQLMAAANTLSQAGAEVTFVPYSGTSAAVADMLGGAIDAAVVTPTTAVSLIGEAVPVVNFGSEPNSEDIQNELGEVPWVGDLGYDGFAMPRWLGVHPDTPDERIQALAEDFESLLGDPSVLALVKRLGEEATWVGPEEAQAQYDRSVKSIRDAISLLE